MNKSIFIGVSIAAIAFSGCAVAAQAQAQEAPSASSGLEDIVVTAERREQNLQAVPISATVLNAAELASKGVNNLVDIQQVAPSVAINTYNRSTFINIRGVGIAQSAPTSNPGVAFYSDGQLLPHEMFIAQSFFDIASIEVLRGPQGTLTGQNSTGGAVYVRTNQPTFDAVSGYADVTVGERNWLKTGAAINVPLSENIAIRVAGIRDKRDSFTRNISAKAISHPGDVNLIAGRYQIAARSSDDNIKVNVRFENFDSDTDGNPIKRRGDVISTNPFEIEEDASSYQKQRGWRLAGETRIGLANHVEMRTMVAFQKQGTYDQSDGDRTDTALPRAPGATTNTGRTARVETNYDTFIGEFNLLSKDSKTFNWVVGGFYLDESVRLNSRTDNFNTVQFTSGTSQILATNYNLSKSLFGQVNLFATENLELLAGARHSWDKQTYLRIVVPGGIPVGTDPTGVANSAEWTGKVGVNYHMGPSLLYVTASRGYKAGGVNLTPGTPNFTPETNTVYESGFKTTVLDRRLRVNGAVFYSDYKDIQFSSLVNGLPSTQNAASGKSYGGELELTGKFGGFGFNFGAGYLHAEFAQSVCINDTNNPGGQRTLCPLGTTATRADSLVAKGSVLPFSPKWTLSGGMQYAIPAGENVTITPRLQWSHIDQQLATPFASVATIVPGRDVFDARLSVDVTSRYHVEAFVTNFTNRKYIASQIQNSSSFDGGQIYGAPRQFGARLLVNFGG